MLSLHGDTSETRAALAAPPTLPPSVSSYLWNFGDGLTSALQNPSHVFPSPGVYSVSLNVVMTNGLTATTLKANYITVLNTTNQLPTITGISDQFTAQFTSTGPIPFTVGHVAFPAASLIVDADFVQSYAAAAFQHSV